MGDDDRRGVRGTGVTLTPQEFVARWERVTLSERASYQQHFLDLCEMLDEPRPADSDAEGSSYTFEKRVEKTGGGTGFADVWRRGRFAIEYKRKGGNLTAAYKQLAEYRESLENPPVMIVTDIARFLVRTNFTGRSPDTFEFTNRELLNPKYRDVLKKAFSAPDSLREVQSPEEITQEAAAGFARLADGMRERGVQPRRAAHFLNRLLFCLFAEDVKLLQENVFSRVVERGAGRPESFNRNIGDLFRAMASGGEFLLHDIRRFNGGLFDQADDADGGVVELTSEELRLLHRTARLDWREVEPAIFGTLFERSLDPAQRARLGAHYTSKDDILAVVEPVLMAPLRREWDDVRQKADDEGERMRAASVAGRRQQARNARAKVEEVLRGFAERLRGVRVLDPACGSGNFLYVALRELLDLEQEVLNHAGGLGLDVALPGVGPEQLFGIETSPYAHELAQVAVWIGYLQWMEASGYGSPPDPVLGPMTNIREMDAILTYDEDGNPTEPEWPEADVIVGNPPFLGGNRIRAELGGEYVEELFRLYESRVPAFADLVCYWFERAREQVESGTARRVGLLATNSIRGGANRRVLQRIKQTGDIFFAKSDEDWILNGAAVRVSMVGFDDGSEAEKVLDELPANAINADLTGSLDLTAAVPLPENMRMCFMGPSAKAPFDIDRELANEMLSAPVNVNGRPNSDVVRPVASGVDLVRRSRGKWTIDFGLMPEEEASLYELPFEYVKKNVLPVRSQSRRDDFQGQWWRYARPRPELRIALEGKRRFIATPAVAKHRVFLWMEPEVLCNQGTLVFAREDDCFFGVLHSRVHELWALRMGTSLEDRPRYTPTTCFETFPLPWPPGEEPDGDPRVEAIAEAARRLDGLRRNWLDPEGASEAELKKRTLTNLYNASPTWLANAHAALDRAVFAAYGWPPDITDEDILKELLALNLERSPGEAG
ncbi:MAG: class I SAM-dependent DNA methyltransferase [Rubrobacteraceae bacterium]